MAELRIRFVTSPGLVSKIINWVTSSEFSHAEIVTESGSYIGAHSDGGVEDRPADYVEPVFERRYAIPCTEEQLAKILAYARSALGTPYNFADILGILFRHNWSTPKRVICSMFVYQCALAGGIQMLNVLPAYAQKVTPDALHLSPLLIGTCYFQSEVPR